MDFAIEISQLNERLTLLEEKESIKDLVYGYVYAVDTKTLDETMALFDDEIFLHYVQDNMEARGKSQVREFYQAVFD